MTLTKKQEQAFKAAKKKAIREAKAHFSKDGWDLDYNCVQEDIIASVISVDMLNDIFMTFLKRNDMTIEMRTHESKIKTGKLREDLILGRTMLTKTVKKGSVYYNEELNDLRIFSSKDKPRAGWVKVGRF